MNTKKWERRDLKERAKVAVKRNYWWCVLAALILFLITGGGSGNSKDDQDQNQDKGPVVSINLSELDIDSKDIGDYVAKSVGGTVYSAGKMVYGLAGGVIGLLLLIIALVAFAIGMILKALLLNPLEVGGRKFFMENEMEKKNGIGSFVEPFKNGYYGNVVVGMFMRDLRIFLWTLLLVIPGLIKAYEYRMVPYILAEHPEMSYKEALECSSNMMNGQKMNAFILDLSFIGWEILAGMTFGILAIFWVNPYEYATSAELYLELSDGKAVAQQSY